MANHRNPLDPSPVWKVRVEQADGVREFAAPWIQIDPERQVVHIWPDQAATAASPILTVPLASSVVYWKQPQLPLPPNGRVG
jgi:hypothetical protein